MKPLLSLLVLTVACVAPGGHAAPDGGANGSGGMLPPRAGVATVAGGAAMSSPHFRLITSTGQGPGDNATMSSRSFVLVGGVAGATQSR